MTKNKIFRIASSGAVVQKKEIIVINRKISNSQNLGRVSIIIFLLKREWVNQKRKIIGINNFKIFKSMVFVGLRAKENGIKKPKNKSSFLYITIKFLDKD